MEIGRTLWIPDITGWWHQPEEEHSMKPNLANVAQDRFSMILHGVGVEASLSLRGDATSWRQLKTAGESFHQHVVIRHFAQNSDRVLVYTDPELDTMNTENVLEMKKEAEERKLHRMARVYNFWRCCRAAKTYVLPRRNLALKASR
jgi:hypothetical protein